MGLIAVMTLTLLMLHQLKRKGKQSFIRRTRMPALLRSSKLWKTFVQDRQEEAPLGRLYRCGNQRQRRRRSRKTKYPARKTVTWSLGKRSPKRAPSTSVIGFGL